MKMFFYIELSQLTKHGCTCTITIHRQNNSPRRGKENHFRLPSKLKIKPLQGKYVNIFYRYFWNAVCAHSTANAE